MTIRDLLESAVTRDPERVALCYRRDGAWNRRSYGELLQGIKLVAAGLSALKLKPGVERLALIVDNGPEWVECYLAAAGSGIAVVPIDPRSKPEEAEFILRDSGSTVAVLQPRHIKWFTEYTMDLPQLRTLVVVTDIRPGWRVPDKVAEIPCLNYNALRTLAAPASPATTTWERARPAPQDMASVIYTSGTTGTPKGVVLTHHNFCADVVGAVEAIGDGVLGPDDDFLVVLPLFHAFSFTANLLLALHCGAGLQFIRSLRTMAGEVRLLHPTVMMVVPLLAEKLLARIDGWVRGNTLVKALIALRLSGWVSRIVKRGLGGRLRFLVVGGAPCPTHVLQGFERLGLPLIEGYGLTECAPVVSINSLSRPRAGSIGRKLPNIEVRIASPDPNGVGELQVRGPIVMKGYLGDPEATAEAFDGEWLRTGDLATIDSEGYMKISGRCKALIVNREGRNIYPEEVEIVIARDPLIADVLVLGYQTGGVEGERVGALIVPDMAVARKSCGGAEPTTAQLERLVNTAVRKQCQSLADYKRPRKIVIQGDPLERTTVQKIRRIAYQGTLNEE